MTLTQQNTVNTNVDIYVAVCKRKRHTNTHTLIHTDTQTYKKIHSNLLQNKT